MTTMLTLLLKCETKKCIVLIIWKDMELGQNLAKTFVELAVLLHKFCQKLRKRSKLVKMAIKILKMI